jgi:prolyl-tRNA synthetase
MGKQVAKNAISPTRQEDYPEWYQQVVKAADLAEQSPVRGCMVIKPWGYGIWENLQRVLDRKIKETGHVNAYFPLFIPLSFFEREAEHVEGFAKECAVVTHHRLEPDGKGGLKPAGPLEEPLVVRPTSETIIGETYAKWVQSYRDLPILINQWANVVRWEMRPRVFLRTAEFLWQEGHTVHATADEAMEETLRMLDVYADFSENVMAVPVIKGEKTPAERFPGADSTYCIEAVMQDRKALQAGTSHFLGQNFAKASNIQFLNAEGKQEFAWTTSWGVSTRLIGALIMVHSDDDGLIVPPRMAPRHVVLMPIYRDDAERSQVLPYCQSLAAELRDVPYFDGKILVDLDDRDIRGGDKAWQHIKRGVPLRVEVGPRDIQSNSVFVGRRDRGPKEKQAIARPEFVATVGKILDDMQDGLFERARQMRESFKQPIDSLAEFEAFFTPKNPDKPEIHGGLALSHWADDPVVEAKLKELKVTARCIPFDGPDEPGKCIFTGKPSKKRVVFAKAY